MSKKRESGRIKEGEHRHVLDAATRSRRLRKALDALEKDNYQDDPHADLVVNRRAPKFEEPLKSKKRRGKRDYKLYFQKKTFESLLRDEQSEPPNYASACVPPSRFPDRHFCSVCGFPSNYTCTLCGARYCCIKCSETHRETRCLRCTV